jgi:hypothetical protein
VVNASFYRAQAALCLRIARSIPQERIGQELIKLAAEYELKAEEMEVPLTTGAAAPWSTATG